MNNSEIDDILHGSDAINGTREISPFPEREQSEIISIQDLPQNQTARSEEIILEDAEPDLDSDTETLTAAQVIELMEEAWHNEKFAPEILPHKFEIVECILGQIQSMEENLQSFEGIDFQKSLHQMEVDRLRYLVTSYLRTRVEKIEIYIFDILKQEEKRHEKNEELYLTIEEQQFAIDYKAVYLGPIRMEVVKKEQYSYETDLIKIILTATLFSRIFLKLHIVGAYPSLRSSLVSPMCPLLSAVVFLTIAMEQHFDNILSFWPGLPPSDWRKEHLVPNMNTFVFLKSKINVDGIVIDGNEDDLVDFKEESQILMSYNNIENLIKKGDVCLI